MTAPAHPVLRWADEHDVPMDTWATAIVSFARADGTTVAVEGQGLDGVDAVEGPSAALGAATVDVLTAWNPRSQEQAREANDRANARLREQLDGVLPAGAVLDATGASPDGSWSEPGFAVLDGEPAVVLELARAHGQHAIYRWTDAGWSVVACDLPDDPLPVPARIVAVDHPPG